MQPVRDARVRSDPSVEEAHTRVLVLESHPILWMEMVREHSSLHGGEGRAGAFKVDTLVHKPSRVRCGLRVLRRRRRHARRARRFGEEEPITSHRDQLARCELP